MHLFDLPWEYVIGQHILCHLSLRELFSLREVCSRGRQVVDIHWSHLRDLDLAQVKGFTVEALQTVVADCHSLRRVNLSDCLWLTDNSFISLVKNNGQLVELNLTNCASISSCSLQTIPGHCRQIKRLYLKGVTLAPHILSDICLRCPCGIERMDLSCSRFLDSTLLWEFVMKQHSLRWLALADCTRVVDEDILWLIGSCSSLEYLNISGCPFRNQQRLIRSIMEKRKCLNHLVITETALDEETQELLKRDTLTVEFIPGVKKLQRSTAISNHLHRAEIPLNFQL